MIKVKEISAGYGGADVLHDISFSLDPGENLSIIGPNGCGKTTLLRVIAGTIGFSGEVLLNDSSVRSMRKKVLGKKVAMLSQHTQIYFNYTVFEIVMMGRYVHGSGSLLDRPSKFDRLAVETALKRVGMLELKDRDVDTLSGGQLQRVFLAKLLAQDPDVILLDEPTNHLDLSYQVEMIRFLKEWSAKEKKTVIGVLHDINLAMLLSDKVLLMEDGRIKALGKCKEVFSSGALESAYKMDVAGYMLEMLKQWEEILTQP